MVFIQTISFLKAFSFAKIEIDTRHILNEKSINLNKDENASHRRRSDGDPDSHFLDSSQEPFCREIIIDGKCNKYKKIKSMYRKLEKEGV